MTDTKPKHEVYPITVEIKPPKGDFPGQIADGFFTFVDGVVTVTDRNGVTAEDPHGKVYTRKLDPGATFADAHSAANFLFREFRLVVLGKTPSSERFSRPLEYRDKGWR
jgi:hypothetical protein